MLKNAILTPSVSQLSYSILKEGQNPLMLQELPFEKHRLVPTED